MISTFQVGKNRFLISFASGVDERERFSTPRRRTATARVPELLYRSTTVQVDPHAQQDTARRAPRTGSVSRALHTGQRRPRNRRTDAVRESNAIAKKSANPTNS